MSKFSTIVFTAGLVVLTGIGFSGSILAGENDHGTKKAAQTEEPAQDEAAKKTGEHARGLLLPYINPALGRKLFASKGCVVCHAINGIGGEDAPPLDAKYRSEERRVGKECRSRWSPYH